MKQTNGKKSNLQSSLELVDPYGALAEPEWRLSVNEIDLETRKDKRLILTKPQTVTLPITNDNSFNTAEYTIGIDKATD